MIQQVKIARKTSLRAKARTRARGQKGFGDEQLFGSAAQIGYDWHQGYATKKYVALEATPNGSENTMKRVYDFKSCHL